MTDWIGLSPNVHAQHSYRPRQGYGHAQGQMLTPVVAAEMAQLLQHYALGFIATADGPVPVALLGGKRDQNLYLHPDGRWLAAYVPASLRNYPFHVAGKEGALVIAAEHLLDNDDGLPLFEQGELAKPVADMLNFLAQRQQNHQLTLAACQALQQAGVLTDWDLQVTLGNAQQSVTGLLRIDEQALNQLDAEQYKTLQGLPMLLAYGQLYSMAQVGQLTERYRLQQQLAPGQMGDVDVEALFGDDDDGDLSFNL